MKLLHSAYPARVAHLLPRLLRYALAFLFVLAGAQTLSQTPLRSFDHVKTGFPLTGIHTSQRCESCHINGVFKGTPKDCASCHTSGLRISPANTIKPVNHIPTQLSCETCHNTQSFGGAKFNHAGVAAGSCASCHNGSTATGKPSGHITTQAACDSCHKTTGWKGAKPDHAAFTAATNCASCHNGTSAIGKPAIHIPVAASVSCLSCHAVKGWKPTKFSHTQVTVAGQCAICHSGAFPPADGKTANHIPYQNVTAIGANAGCESCHKGGFAAWAPAKLHASVTVSVQCATCHTGANPLAVGKPANHLPTAATCESCHKTTGWRGGKPDHAMFTAATNCASCHNGTNATGKPGNHLPTTANCISCHTTTLWTGARVDHSILTAATNCASCHNGATAIGKSGIHIPTTGNCVSCHNTSAWKPSGFNHTQATVTNQCSTCHSGAFPPADGRTVNHTPYERLSGVAITNCDTCHKAGFGAWAPARLHSSVSVINQCATCHIGTKPSTPIHAGVTNCEVCHKTTGWAGAKVDHSGFTIATNCATCHNGAAATGKPAVHIPAGAANCISCHTTTVWKPSRFNHTQTVVANQCSTCHSGAFPPADGRPVTHIPYQALSGAAITNCDTCHTAGFATWAPARFHSSVSVSAQCSTCHNGSFPPAVSKPATPIHTGVTNCESCHRTTGWAGAKVNHSTFTAATNCATCHNGTTATGKSALHIPVGAGNCMSCHTTTAWLPSRFNHTQVIVAGQCSGCHSGAYPPAHARPATHIPYQTLTGVVITNCDTCHRGGFSAWAPARFHGSVTVAGQCAGCHTGLFPPARARPNTPVHVGVMTCESCHRSTASWLTVVFAHSPANAVGTGTCDTCHNGLTAKGKSVTHIPVVGGVAKCDSCHRSQTSFVGATMNHSVVTTSTCKSCHNGSYVTQGRTGALAKPVNHIPEMLLLNGASMDCNTCHTGTTSWTTLRMNHNNSLGGGAGSCKACHSSGTNYLGNMQKMALTHKTKTPPATDCSESGCHRPLGSRGATYTNWN